MWDAIVTLLSGDNALLLLLFIIVFVALVSVLAKVGVLSINFKGLSVGAGAKEREIIRQQMVWVHAYIQGLEVDITKMSSSIPGYDVYKTKYVLEVMYDDVVEWITYNHISTDPAYVAIKQDGLRAHLKSLGLRDEFVSAKFLNCVDKWALEIITKLVMIKDTYNK